MKVLVTGATGFLGREIVKELLANDFEVLGISRTSSANINCVQIDITVESEVEKLKRFDDIDAIIHCAGLAHQFGKTSRDDFIKVNVKGTENIVKLANYLKIQHFILISSVSVYGNAKKEFNSLKFQEEAQCSPIGDYAESKFEAEKVSKNISKNINVTILRPATIIGEGDKGNVLRLIQTIDKNRFIQIGKCENYKTLVDKNYVAKVCLQIVKNKLNGVYNLANPPLMMSDIIETIYQSLGKRRIFFNIPEIIALYFAKIVDKTFRKNFTGTIVKWTENDVYSQRKLEIALSNLPQVNIKTRLKEEVKCYINNK